ncbi:MAG TPA: PTS sugar transporter subunit IIA [Thermoanaerobaculia bacterium]|nr:PTS sugar transporter subunit IIA [Thermoanaerobaculia bacterium]
MMRLASLLRPELIFVELPAVSWEEVLRLAAARIAASGRVATAADLAERLLAREASSPTGLGDGIALPHCKVPNLEAPLVAVGTVEAPGASRSADADTVRVFFLVISPEAQPAMHLQVLAAISRWLKERGRVEQLVAARSPGEVLALLGDGDAT